MRSERGIALVLMLMVTLVLTGLAAAVIPLTTTETAVVFNHRRSLQMVYAAEAALEWGIQELATVRSWDDALVGTVRSGFWGGATDVQLLDGTSVDLDDATPSGWAGPSARPGDNRRWRLFGFGRFDRLIPGRVSVVGLIVAVWISDDPDDPDGDPLVDQNAIIDVRAAAIGRAHTVRAIHASVRRDPGGHVRVAQWRHIR